VNPELSREEYRPKVFNNKVLRKTGNIKHGKTEER
jgi:hypothetical protein